MTTGHSLRSVTYVEFKLIVRFISFATGMPLLDVCLNFANNTIASCCACSKTPVTHAFDDSSQITNTDALYLLSTV